MKKESLQGNWLSNGILYQIFPDRFNIGNKLTIHDKVEKGLYPEDCIPRNWDQLPDKVGNYGRHFYGGDLLGIAEKLDYLKELGVDSLYLTPIFKADSYHKYDALDFKQIDDALGGQKQFDAFLNELHTRQMRLIIDIAFNHISDQHPYFVDAGKSTDSKFRNFFYFNEHPHDYNGWRGSKRMPEVRLEDQEVLREFITGEDSIIKFWLEKGVNGIRLDCANDLGRSICKIITETAKKIKPDAIVLGEVFNFASDWADVLDGVQSYFLTSSIYSLLEGKISSTQFGLNIQKMYQDFPLEKLLNCLNMLSSHDYKRALTLINGNVKQYLLALILQFTLPGTPMIYYGEEVGMVGGDDPLNRAPMQWNQDGWNQEIHAFYKKIIKLRKERVEFRVGKLIELSQWLSNGVIAYMRHTDVPEEFSLTIVNSTEEKKTFRLFIPYSYLFDGVMLEDIFSGKRVKGIGNYIDFEIEAMTGAVYVPDFTFIKNYTFYKKR